MPEVLDLCNFQRIQFSVKGVLETFSTFFCKTTRFAFTRRTDTLLKRFNQFKDVNCLPGTIILTPIKFLHNHKVCKSGNGLITKLSVNRPMNSFKVTFSTTDIGIAGRKLKKRSGEQEWQHEKADASYPTSKYITFERIKVRYRQSEKKRAVHHQTQSWVNS